MISGGEITAKGGSGAAGIGNGYNSGTVSSIIIDGGIITANSGAWIFLLGDPSGIGGGGYSGSHTDSIMINGGTVNAVGAGSASGIGSGNGSTSNTITIDGGSISGSVSSQPYNSSGVPVYLNTLTVQGRNGKNVAWANIDGIDCAEMPSAAEGVYGIRDVKTNSNGKLYFYLPAVSDKTVVVAISAMPENDVFGKKYTRLNNHNNQQTLNPGIFLRWNHIEEETGELLETQLIFPVETGTDLTLEAQQIDEYYPLYGTVTGHSGQCPIGTSFTVTGSTTASIYYAEADYNLNVSIPVQMVWAAFESYGGEIISPIHTITNLSQRPVDVAIESVSVLSTGGVRFVQIIEENGDLRLDLLGVADTPFDGVDISGLNTSGASLGEAGVLGRLGGSVTPGISPIGQFTFSGWYQGDLSESRLPALKAVIKLELAE